MILLSLLGFYLLGMLAAYPIVFATLTAKTRRKGWLWVDDENKHFAQRFCWFSWMGIFVAINEDGYHGFRWR